jgi:hypothetical protein
MADDMNKRGPDGSRINVHWPYGLGRTDNLPLRADRLKEFGATHNVITGDVQKRSAGIQTDMLNKGRCLGNLQRWFYVS